MVDRATDRGIFKRGWRAAWQWTDERLDLSGVEKLAAKKSVPVHRHSLWYYFGGITLFLFCVQVGTGILLLLYDRPTAEAAFESVQFIMTEVRFGWLIRSIHSWAANLMVATAFIHLFSVFFLKAYRKPRELTWVSGVLLLFLTLAFSFSGYLLPWNELAFFATKVGTEIVAVVPLIGEPLLRFMRGGEEVTGATLTRFFGLHVAILPMLTTALLLIHLIFIQKQGMSVPPRIEKAGRRLKEIPFFPNFVLREFLAWILAVAALAALAALFPWELGIKADPFAPAPAGIRPEWYFVFLFQTLKYVPANVLFIEGELLAIAAFGVLGLVVLLVPFIDRSDGLSRRSKIVSWAGAVVLIYVVVMTVIGYTVPQTF